MDYYNQLDYECPFIENISFLSYKRSPVKNVFNTGKFITGRLILSFVLIFLKLFSIFHWKISGNGNITAPGQYMPYSNLI